MKNMKKRYAIFCLLLSSIVGCMSLNSSEHKICGTENLLVITSYGDYPNNRLVLRRDGTYTWRHFDRQNLTWQQLFSGNLKENESSDIEKQLKKASSGLHWKTTIKLKDEYGNEVEIEPFKVIRKNGCYVFDFSEFNSFTMSPDVIMAVLDKCEYNKVWR